MIRGQLVAGEDVLMIQWKSRPPNNFRKRWRPVYFFALVRGFLRNFLRVFVPRCF
jgi:hypothetical protein